MDKEEIKKLLAFISIKENANETFLSVIPKQSSETIVKACSYNESDNFLNMWGFVNEECKDSIAEYIAEKLK
jgi:hypothetical protein